MSVAGGKFYLEPCGGEYLPPNTVRVYVADGTKWGFRPFGYHQTGEAEAMGHGLLLFFQILLSGQHLLVKQQ